MNRSLTKKSLELAHQLYEISLQTTNQNQRQTHAALQTKLNSLLGNIRLYDKGIRLLPNDLQTQLTKYLLKSFGNDVCNDIFLYVAAECNMNYTEATLKPEHRTKIAQECGNTKLFRAQNHFLKYLKKTVPFSTRVQVGLGNIKQSG